MLNSQQIELVQKSFAKVAPIADTAAKLFYERLFATNPQLRPLFPEEMTDQRGKLMKTLAVAVAGLTKVDSIVPVLQRLGKRHAAYGVEDEHYDIVGETLIWTLKTGLGDEFTDEVRDAWLQTYTIVADVMKAAAAEALAEAWADVIRLEEERDRRAANADSALARPFESREFQDWLQRAADGESLGKLLPFQTDRNQAQGRRLRLTRPSSFRRAPSHAER